MGYTQCYSSIFCVPESPCDFDDRTSCVAESRHATRLPDFMSQSIGINFPHIQSLAPPHTRPSDSNLPTMASTFERVYEKLFSSTVLLPRTRMDGQRILVTGATGGLGFEAAKHFSRQGATVILGCRSMEKARDARETIHALGGGGGVEIAQLDMESFASVREFAASVGELDGAVLNAGVASEDWKVTEEGWEVTLQVNVLSTALLGVLLLQKMAAQARKRKEVSGGGEVALVPTISIVASEMYAFADFDALVAAAEGNVIRALNDETKFKRGES